MKVWGTGISVFLMAIASLPAQGQVNRCTEMMPPITDESMQRSVVALESKRPGLRFQTDDQPCRHAKETVIALRKTLDRNYLTSISGYEFVKILNGESYFTIERFMSRNRQELQKLETALKSLPARKLKVEANTSYDFFMVRGGFVLMISSAVGHDDNAELFRQLRPFFPASGADKSER